MTRSLLLLVFMLTGCALTVDYSDITSTQVELPLDSRQEVLSYAHQEFFVEEDFFYEQPFNQSHVEVFVEIRSSRYMVLAHSKRYDQGLESKQEKENQIKRWKSIGDHWYVRYQSTNVVPSYSCVFQITKEGVLLERRCAWNK